MKKYLILALTGLAFGIMSGALGNAITHIDSDVFNGFSTVGNWYDWLTIFEMPGETISWKVYNPSDTYLGDDSAYWLSIVIFNGLTWMLAIPTLWFYVGLARSFPRDLKPFFQKWSFLIKLVIQDRLNRH